MATPVSPTRRWTPSSTRSHTSRGSQALARSTRTTESASGSVSPQQSVSPQISPCRRHPRAVSNVSNAFSGRHDTAAATHYLPSSRQQGGRRWLTTRNAELLTPTTPAPRTGWTSHLRRFGAMTTTTGGSRTGQWRSRARATSPARLPVVTSLLPSRCAARHAPVNHPPTRPTERMDRERPRPEVEPPPPCWREGAHSRAEVGPVTARVLRPPHHRGTPSGDQQSGGRRMRVLRWLFGHTTPRCADCRDTGLKTERTALEGPVLVHCPCGAPPARAAASRGRRG